MAQQRTTANDPNFLDTFGSTSRLAFLGGKKDEIWQEVFDTNAREVTPPRPPTNGRQRVVFHVDMDAFFAGSRSSQPITARQTGRGVPFVRPVVELRDLVMQLRGAEAWSKGDHVAASEA